MNDSITLVEKVEQLGWSFLSEDSLQRVWDNAEDARYDQWFEFAKESCASQSPESVERIDSPLEKKHEHPICD